MDGRERWRDWNEEEEEEEVQEGQEGIAGRSVFLRRKGKEKQEGGKEGGRKGCIPRRMTNYIRLFEWFIILVALRFMSSPTNL